MNRLRHARGPVQFHIESVTYIFSTGTTNGFEEFMCFGAGVFADCLLHRPEVWISEDKEEMEEESKDKLIFNDPINGQTRKIRKRK